MANVAKSLEANLAPFKKTVSATRDE